MPGPARKKQLPKKCIYEAEPQQGGSRKVVVTLAVIVGLAVIGWGGYQMYKKNAAKLAESESSTTDSINRRDDSIRNAIAADSIAALKEKVRQAAAFQSDSGVMKFIILQTHNKERALKRYNQLLNFQLKIKMDTQDSSFFKVYFSFPASFKDTVHIKDSLRREYAHEVVIEK